MAKKVKDSSVASLGEALVEAQTKNPLLGGLDKLEAAIEIIKSKGDIVAVVEYGSDKVFILK